MNEQNIEKHKYNADDPQSASRARENGRKGGINAGKARRERRALKDTLNTIMSAPLPKDADNLKRTLQQFGIKDGDYASLLMVTLFQKALKGDLKALSMVMDILSEDELKRARIALTEAQTEKIKTSEVDIEDLSDIEERIYENDPV